MDGSKNDDTIDFNAEELFDMVGEEIVNQPVNPRRSGRKRVSAEKKETEIENEQSAKVKKVSNNNDIKEEANKEKRKKKKKAEGEQVEEEKKSEPNNENEEEKKPKKKGKKNAEENDKNKEEKTEKGEEKKSNPKITRKKVKKEDKVEEEENTKEEEKKGKKKKKNEEESQEKVSKPKGKKDHGESDEKTTILNYMIEQNRPFSYLMVFDNLHGKIRKANVINILEELTEEGKLIRKEYGGGKTKIYLASQNLFPAIDEEESKRLNIEMEELKKENEEKTQRLKKLQNEYRMITGKLTDEELKKQIIEKKKLLEETKKRLNIYVNGEYNKVPDEEVKVKEKNFENAKNRYRKTKKVCIDIVDGFCESMEMKRPEIMKMMNLDEEEENDLQYTKFN